MWQYNHHNSDSLQHAKGHKYIAKAKMANGESRYFYTEQEYQAFLRSGSRLPTAGNRMRGNRAASTAKNAVNNLGLNTSAAGRMRANRAARITRDTIRDGRLVPTAGDRMRGNRAASTAKNAANSLDFNTSAAGRMRGNQAARVAQETARGARNTNTGADYMRGNRAASTAKNAANSLDFNTSAAGRMRGNQAARVAQETARGARNTNTGADYMRGNQAARVAQETAKKAKNTTTGSDYMRGNQAARVANETAGDLISPKEKLSSRAKDALRTANERNNMLNQQNVDKYVGKQEEKKANIDSVNSAINKALTQDTKNKLSIANNPDKFKDTLKTMGVRMDYKVGDLKDSYENSSLVQKGMQQAKRLFGYGTRVAKRKWSDFVKEWNNWNEIARNARNTNNAYGENYWWNPNRPTSVRFKSKRQS